MNIMTEADQADLHNVIAMVDRALNAHKATPPDRDAQRPIPVDEYLAFHQYRFVRCELNYDIGEVKNPWLDTLLEFIPIWNRDLHEIRYVVLTTHIAAEFIAQTRGCYPGHGANPFYKNNYAKSYDLGLIGTIAGRNSVTVLRHLEPSAIESILAF